MGISILRGVNNDEQSVYCKPVPCIVPYLSGSIYAAPHARPAACRDLPDVAIGRCDFCEEPGRRERDRCTSRSLAPPMERVRGYFVVLLQLGHTWVEDSAVAVDGEQVTVVVPP